MSLIHRQEIWMIKEEANQRIGEGDKQMFW
jgi:hypothetical protein